MFAAMHQEVIAEVPLQDEFRISAGEYAKLYESSSSLLHILLDVRSTSQFSIVNLSEGKTARTVNIPLKDLKTMTKHSFYAHIREKLSQFGQEQEQDGLFTVPIFTLCRRGIDSVTAAKFLMAENISHEVKNIDGGLSSWHAEVDIDFPLY